MNFTQYLFKMQDELVVKSKEKNVLQKFPKPDWAVQWVPHGVNTKHFFPITPLHKEWDAYNKFQQDFKTSHNAEFVVFWNNRNIRRKQPGDLIIAYKEFCDKINIPIVKEILNFSGVELV